MDDLISRKALLEKFGQWRNQVKNGIHYGDRIIYDVLQGAMDVINEEDAIDAEPVRHGGTTWDVFDDLASSYYGKQMYFTQPDGTIYSRLSCGYMTFEEALAEFREAIGMDGGKKDG